MVGASRRENLWLSPLEENCCFEEEGIDAYSLGLPSPNSSSFCSGLPCLDFSLKECISSGHSDTVTDMLKSKESRWFYAEVYMLI